MFGCSSYVSRPRLLLNRPPTSDLRQLHLDPDVAVVSRLQSASSPLIVAVVSRLQVLELGFILTVKKVDGLEVLIWGFRSLLCEKSQHHLLSSTISMVGVASFISLLVQKVGGSIKPFTSTLLRLLFQVAKEEKSGASKRAFAKSCAFVIKYAPTPQVHKLIEETAALYNGDRNSQIACALLLKSYASTAGDIFTGYYATVVPVIFLSRFEDDKNVSSLYEELWEENMTSERVTLQLYVGEIVTMITDGIASSSWASKRKAGKAIVKLCEVLEESLFLYHQVLLTSLMNEITGRIWEGKEDLLEALSSLCTTCHTAITAADPSRESAILSVVTSACSKKTKKFRDAGFRCLENVKTITNYLV